MSYGYRMRARGVASVLWYSVLRIGLFFGIWLPIQLLTQLRGLWAVVIALVASGLVSAFVLNRQRNAMSETVGGFFSRINERIEASTRAEDWPEGEPQAEQQAITEGGQAGGLEDGHERGSERTASHPADGRHRDEERQERDQRHG